jgi:hypothetical protein
LLILIIFLLKFSYSKSLDGTGPATVYSFAYNGSKLIIAGDFDICGGVRSPNLCSFDDVNGYQAMIFSIDNPIYTVYYHPVSNFLYIGGRFSMVDGVVCNFTCYFNGVSWLPLANSFNNVVYSIIGHPTSNSVWLCGAFTYSGMVNAKYVANYSVAANNISVVGNGFDGVCRTLAYGTTIYAGGAFMASGSTPTPYAAKLLGLFWVHLSSNGLDGAVTSMAFLSNTLYLAGAFTIAGGSPAQNIAA